MRSMITKNVYIKAYAYFKGELERAYTNKNRKLIKHYIDEIQKLFTRFNTQNC